MSKIVKVTNADQADSKVVVEIWQDTDNKNPIETYVLEKPGDSKEFIVYPSQYLLVKELEGD